MYRVLNGTEKKKHFSLVVTDENRVCPTLTKDAGNTCTGFIHPDRKRKLSIPEALRIHSFPDDFSLIGKYKEQWSRIGNSVPPLLMKAIAGHIKAEVLQHG